MLPVVLHQGNDPIACGCRAPGGNFAFGTFSGRILITEGEDLKVKNAGLDIGAFPYAMAILSDKVLVTTGTERIVFDMTTWKHVWDREKKGSEGDQITLFDDRRVITDTSELLIERIDIETGASDFAFDQSNSADGSVDSPQSFRSVEVSPDHKLLAIGLQTGTSIVDLETAKEKLYLRQPQWGPKHVVFSPDSQMVYAAGSALRTWDLSTGKVVQENANVPHDIYAMAISSDGSLIALAAEGVVNFPCHVFVFDNKLQFICRFEAGLSKVTYLAFRENSNELITASCGGDIKLWDLRK